MKNLLSQLFTIENQLDQISYEIEDTDILDSVVISKFDQLLKDNLSSPYIFNQIKKYNSIGNDKLCFLHHSVKYLRSSLCSYLINTVFCDVNSRSKSMLTPLHTLMNCYQGYDDKDFRFIETFDVLIKNKAWPNALDESNLSVIDHAIMNNNYTGVKLLVGLGNVNLKAKNEFIPSPFHIACKLGNDKIILLLMENIEAENLVDTYNKEAPIHLLLDNSKEEKLDTTRAILKKISQGKKYLLDFIMLNSLTQKNCSVLQLAMDNEYLNIVDMILKDYYPKNFCADINGNCPMHLAACTGNIELLEILVKNNAITFAGNRNGDTPLHLAAINNKPKFITNFLKLEADFIYKNRISTDILPCVRKLNNSNQTPLFSAVAVNSDKSVEALLKSGDIQELTTNDEGDTVVHLCSKFSTVESLRYLLKNKKFFDTLFIQNSSHESPLHIAARLGHLEVFKLIMTLLNIGNQETKEYCLSLKDTLGRTCFHLACFYNRFSLVEYLICDLKLLFLIEMLDFNKNSGLHLAAMNDNHFAVDIMIKASLKSKSILVSRNSAELTPLEISMSMKFFQTSKIIIEALDIVETKNNRINLLHLAANEGSHDIVRLLLEKKVPINSLSSKMQNVLDLAIDKGHKEVIKVLIRDPGWKNLFEYERTPLNMKHDLGNLSFLQKKRQFGPIENPQLLSLYQKEYWDIFLMILEKCKVDEGLFDLEILNPPLNSIQLHPLMLIAKSGQQILIKHESTRVLIHLKWSIIPRLIFYCLLVFYLLFIVFFSLYSTELTELNFANLETSDSIDSINDIWSIYGYESKYKHIILAMLYSICFIIVLKTFLFGILQYLFSKSTISEITMLIFSFISIYSNEMSIKVHYTSLAVLLIFVNFSLLLQKVPKIGVYVLAFQRTVINSIRFIPMTILTYSAFLLAFRIRSDTNLTLFTNLSTADAFVNGLTMALGDYKTNEMGIKDSTINYSLYLLFIGIMSIIILNLLVGIAVGELNKTLEQADVQYISMRIRFCLQVQSSVKLFKKSDFFNSLYRIMDKSHWIKSKNDGAVGFLSNLKRFLKFNSEPKIVLDDQQTRIDKAIVELSQKTEQNFKTIKETITQSIFEVNEKLRSSKQRLEDCVVELSRKTETNFEANAEDSNDALDSFEVRITNLLSILSSRISSLETLSTRRIESTRNSIIQHIKNSSMVLARHFQTVNITKNVDETSKIVEKRNLQEDLKDILNLFSSMSRRIDKFEDNLYKLQKEISDNQERILMSIYKKLSVIDEKGQTIRSLVVEDSVTEYHVDMAHSEALGSAIAETFEMKSVENESEVAEKISSNKNKASDFSLSSLTSQIKPPKKEAEIPDISEKILLFNSSDWSKINEIANKEKKKAERQNPNIFHPDLNDKNEIFESQN